MRPMKRAVHIDFHTMPGIHDFNRDWDPAEFARILQDAHVAYINAFARCNIGFAYYPTKIGIPYPGMKGDMFGDLLEQCRRRDIGVSAYMNVGLDHERSSRHMDWLRLDREGRVIRGDRTGNFFRTLCYNNPDYRDYHFGMLREIRAYDPDGYFLDCMVVEPCWCVHCLRKMKDLGIDPDNETANRLFQHQSMVEFSRESRAAVGEGTYFYANGMHYETVRDLDTHIEVECLPGRWGYDYFWPYASYARNLQDTVLYMTGRFQTSWGDFGGFKTRASLEHDYYDALCAGVGVSVGDHMHPAGNLDKDIYRTVGELNAMILALEPYTEGTRFMADIGVLTASEYNPEARGHAGLTDSHKGLSRMLGELRQSYDIINETMDFTKYRVLILPDRLPMSDMFIDKLAEFLQSGGRILSSGTAGLREDGQRFALPQWDFVCDGPDTSNASYFHLCMSSDPMLADMDYCTYSSSGVLIRGGDMVARYVKAYFDRHWDGFHGYFYTPPEKSTGHAAAAIGGDGSVCHISFEVFRAYYESGAYAHKALVRECLHRLLPDPLIDTIGIPSTARVTAAGCDDYTLLHVKVTYPEVRGLMNIIEEHAVLGAGAQVRIRGDYRRACALPGEEPLEVVRESGYSRIRLPEITGYKAFRLRR